MLHYSDHSRNIFFISYGYPELYCNTMYCWNFTKNCLRYILIDGTWTFLWKKVLQYIFLWLNFLVSLCLFMKLREHSILIFGVSQRSNSIKGVLQSVKILLANKNCSHLVVSKCLQSFITCWYEEKTQPPNFPFCFPLVHFL